LKKTILVICILLISSLTLAASSVRIEDTTKKDLVNVLIQDWNEKGFSLLSNTENIVIFRKPSPDVKFMDLYGIDSELQVAFKIVQIDKGIEVSVEAEAVSFPGKAIQLGWSLDMPELQRYLIDLKNGFNGYIGYGLGFAQNGIDWVVEYLTPGGAGEKTGVKVGDIILSANDKMIQGKSINEINDIFLTGGEGTKLDLVLKRADGKEVKLTITKTKVLPRYKSKM
jgi:hypothetical protein